MADRGASKEEVELTIRTGECFPAKKGRLSFRKNFSYNAIWKGKIYQVKQVIPIVVEEPDKFVVVTVYVYFIGGVK
jgi:hypothetical protein